MVILILKHLAENYHLNDISKDIVWSINQLEELKKFYASEYQRTKENHYLNFQKEIQKYLTDYYNIIDKLGTHSTEELRLYKYIKNGLNVTKAVQKVAEENYLADQKPATETNIWIKYRKLKEFLQT